MTRNRTSIYVLLPVALALLAAMPARAASLQQVSSWGASGVPTYISMYIYVPDKLATNPPIVVLSHYCGGNASGVFGQAGSVKTAADQNGFIIIAPQTSNNCWDVGSTKSLTHDGGGDTQAIAQMVKYAITKYSANPDRVYATGDSSGGMMTEALLAVYPDVFKGGSSFAGVPAGCWADGYSSSNQWSGNCAGGKTTFSAQQWGDKVRAMDSGYTGHRPRVQLFHGDADSTISYNNMTEAIKEWTNVLGLDTNPTTTDTGLTLGSHQAKRQRWKNTCGYVVLEAWTSIGGDHGPSDALFNSNLVPFLGLDKTGAVDPEIAQCAGDGGAGGGPGAGGSTGAGGGGGGSGAGGTSGGRDGGQGGRLAGNTGTGGGVAGVTGSGGSIGTGGRGGAPGTGGAQATGGSAGRNGSGGSVATGGSVNSGGSSGSGGTPASGGSQSGGTLGNGGSGGTLGAGGTAGSGGSSTASGGTAGGAGGSSGSGGATTGDGTAASGCTCVLGEAPSKRRAYGDVVVALGLALLALARRRRRDTR
jgi:poly(hydroxyalkanoate) depolymerase family esterase